MGVNDEKTYDVVDISDDGQANVPDIQPGHMDDNADQLQRHLGNRQIQLMAIGGSIGTALFVSIGGALARGGPGSLFIAYLIYSIMLGFVNNSCAEMTILHPVSGGFIRLAGKYVDDAFGFMAGWNFFFYEALLIPFEITALNLVIDFWIEDPKPGYAAAIIAACIVCYALLNVLAVKTYGEAEFWLSGGKVLLIIMLFSFTFITMVGGNPKHDAYGFRYWNNPGAFAEHHSKGALGRFEGFLAALWSASFTIVGPEYISMVAAEAKRPRIYIKNAFKTVYWRFGLFFIVGSLCIGVVVAYNDKALVNVVFGSGTGAGTAAASPYVIAMRNLGIDVLPHITNALMMTSIFSAGNTYTYCSTRSLYSLAIEGRAPAFLKRCTKSGVPIYCFLVVMIFPFLSFLQLGNTASIVLGWLVALITAGGIINYIVMTTTYIHFYNACKAQGIDRKTFPYYAYFQPWSTYMALVWMCLVVFFFGYSSFYSHQTADDMVAGFFSYYTMLIISPILFISWKLIHKTKRVDPRTADLIWERPIIDAYEATFISEPVGFWTEMLQLIGLRRKAQDRRGSVAVVHT